MVSCGTSGTCVLILPLDLNLTKLPWPMTQSIPVWAAESKLGVAWRSFEDFEECKKRIRSRKLL